MLTAPSAGRSRVAALLAFLSALALAAAARGQEHKIRIHRPEKPGDAYTVSASGDSKVVATSNIPGTPPKQESAFTVQLDATVKVLEVDKTGTASKVACTVDKCLRDNQPLFDKGTVVTAENQNGKAVYTVNGEKVEAPAAEALEVVLPTHHEGDKDDDAAFGTDQPQKVGGTWPIDAAAAAENLARGGELPAKKENVKGTGKLAAVKQVDGKDVLQVEIDMNVSDLRGAMPAGATIDGGSFEFHAMGLLPADENAKPLGQEVKVKAKMRIKTPAPDNQEFDVDVDLERNAKATFGEVKEGK